MFCFACVLVLLFACDGVGFVLRFCVVALGLPRSHPCGREVSHSVGGSRPWGRSFRGLSVEGRGESGRPPVAGDQTKNQCPYVSKLKSWHEAGGGDREVRRTRCLSAAQPSARVRVDEQEAAPRCVCVRRAWTRDEPPPFVPRLSAQQPPPSGRLACGTWLDRQGRIQRDHSKPAPRPRPHRGVPSGRQATPLLSSLPE